MRRKRRHVWNGRSIQPENFASASVIRRRRCHRPSGTTSTADSEYRRRPCRDRRRRRHHTASRSGPATCCVSRTWSTRTRAPHASDSWPTAPVCRRHRSATGSRIDDRETEPRPPRTGDSNESVKLRSTCIQYIVLGAPHR